MVYQNKKDGQPMGDRMYAWAGVRSVSEPITVDAIAALAHERANPPGGLAPVRPQS